MVEINAALAQLGERQTEDLKAPCSIHGGGIYFFFGLPKLGISLPTTVLKNSVQSNTIIGRLNCFCVWKSDDLKNQPKNHKSENQNSLAKVS